jgi:hypothetical protein
MEMKSRRLPRKSNNLIGMFHETITDFEYRNCFPIIYNYNNNSVALVRERTKSTERPPLVGEVSVSFYLRIEGHRVDSMTDHLRP